MPFTPVHMGAGMLVKAGLRERFSLMMFGWAQIVMDIQPLMVMIAGTAIARHHAHLRGCRHRGGATITGKHSPNSAWCCSSCPSIAPSPGGSRCQRVHRHPSPVLLHSVMPADLQPFAPWRDDNPFLGFITIDALHWVCFGAGALGFALYLLPASTSPAGRRAPRGRSQARRLD